MRRRVGTAGDAATSDNARNAGSGERRARRNRGTDDTKRPRTKAQRRKAQEETAVDDGGFPSPQPTTKRQKRESAPVDDGGFPSPPSTSPSSPKPATQPQPTRPSQAAPAPAQQAAADQRAFERDHRWLNDIPPNSNYVIVDNAGNVLYDHSGNNSDLVHKGSVIDAEPLASNGSPQAATSNPAGGRVYTNATVRSNGMATTSAEPDASTSATQTQAWDESERTARASAARFDGEARQAREEAGRLANRPDMAEAAARLHREATAAEQTADHRRGMAAGYAAIRSAVFGQNS
jgi:hypothetical protein